MKTKTLALAAVVAAAGAIIAVKAIRQRPVDAAVATVAERGSVPAVVLVADPREADASCGCGQIIRRVREAKARGVVVEELAPGDPGAARHGVTVVPTVLVLGGDGRVIARREGESSEILTAIAADLDALESQRP